MRITHHAGERMIRRRISHQDVELTIGYGQELHCAGATFYVLRFRDIPAVLRRDPAARRAEGTTVVVTDDVIRTVYRNRDVRAVRQKPRHGRAERWARVA
jgi:hypothetical protein